jgi:hypothetical protein
VIREVTAGMGTISTAAGSGTVGYAGDGGPATSAKLDYPRGIVTDSAGNLYIADTANNVIRKVTAATGTIATDVGNGYGAGGDPGGYLGDGGLATSAELNQPFGVTVDGAGNLYIADTSNNVIRKVTASTGIISTVAGTGDPGTTGNGGLATGAKLSNPVAVAADSAGNLYIADNGNNVIRKVMAATGIISTMAGTGLLGSTGDGGPATSANMTEPEGVVLDGAGNLDIVDGGYNLIRQVAVGTVPMLSYRTSTNVGSGWSEDGGGVEHRQCLVDVYRAVFGQQPGLSGKFPGQ